MPLLIWNENQTIYCINANKNTQKGTYILYIHLLKDISLVFGRFRGGKLYNMPAGYYTYVGSALSERGATTIGNRLQRHQSRSNGVNHLLKSEFIEFCHQIGLHTTKKSSCKTNFWNIDYLTSHSMAEIEAIIMIKSSGRLENTWSKFIENLNESHVFAQGLGANDTNGHTHLVKTSLNKAQFVNLAKGLPFAR